MRRISANLFAMFLALCLPTISEAKGWRGIVPLKSTRAHVEQLLGVPGSHGRYHFEKERAYINYAGAGPCHPINGCLCVLPKDTVISIYVELEVEMRFSGLKLDKKKYEKQISPQNPTIATYANDEEGIIYTVDEEDDDVRAIEYIPSAKDCKEVLRQPKTCRRSRLVPQSRNEKEYLIRRFDEYSDLSSEDEKARLDSFAIYLAER